MELFSKPNLSKESSIFEEQKSVEKDETEPSFESILNARTFEDLGVCDWILRNTRNIGFKFPTAIQKAAIPAILSGKDVLACSATGTGKTAAFAIPILQHLSADPFGIFAVILSPTRELALQISDQMAAIGASFNLKIASIIGGMNIVEQGQALSRRPHIIVCTPGRIAQYLESSDPPDLSKTRFLVLDEADRLLAAGFSEHLETVLTRFNPKRQTLLFSATLTVPMETLNKLAVHDALRFDLTLTQKTPAALIEQYVFMPARVKTAFLVAHLQPLIVSDSAGSEKRTKGTKGKQIDNSEKSTAESVIVFVGSCYRCEYVSELLRHLGFDCVSLHGLMNQTARIDSLNKFKSELSRMMVCTDISSRGLDIPTVSLVINFDLPKISSDYIHRVGRTARAGRNGRAVSFVTQFDVALVQEIEEHIGHKLSLCSDVTESDVLKHLNAVSKAARITRMDLMDSGFEEKAEVIKKRKRKEKRRTLRIKTPRIEFGAN